MDNLEFSQENIKAQKKKYYASFLWKLTVAIVIVISLQFIILIPVSVIKKMLLIAFTNPASSLSGLFEYSTFEKILSVLAAVIQLIVLTITDGAGALFLYYMTKKTACSPMKRDMPFGYWLVTFLICFGLGGIFMLIGSIVETIVLAPGTVIRTLFNNLLAAAPGNVVENIIYADDSWLYFFAQVLVAGIGVPIIEELFFRKLVIDNTSKYGFGAAVMISAFTFAAFHFNFRQFFYAFALGLLFAYVYAFTGKIKYTIAFHIGYNLYSALIMPVATRMMPKGTIESLLESTSLLSENLKANPDMAMDAYNIFWEDLKGIAETPGFIFGISVLLLVRLFYFFLIFVGIVLFVIFLHKAINVRKEMPMGEKGTKRCAAFNYGAVLFYVLSGTIFFVYYLIANIASIFGG